MNDNIQIKECFNNCIGIHDECGTIPNSNSGLSIVDLGLSLKDISKMTDIHRTVSEQLNEVYGISVKRFIADYMPKLYLTGDYREITCNKQASMSAFKAEVIYTPMYAPVAGQTHLKGQRLVKNKNQSIYQQIKIHKVEWYSKNDYPFIDFYIKDGNMQTTVRVYDIKKGYNNLFLDKIFTSGYWVSGSGLAGRESEIFIDTSLYEPQSTQICCNCGAFKCGDCASVFSIECVPNGNSLSFHSISGNMPGHGFVIHYSCECNYDKFICQQIASNRNLQYALLYKYGECLINSLESSNTLSPLFALKKDEMMSKKLEFEARYNNEFENYFKTAKQSINSNLGQDCITCLGTRYATS